MKVLIVGKPDVGSRPFASQAADGSCEFYPDGAALFGGEGL